MVTAENWTLGHMGTWEDQLTSISTKVLCRETGGRPPSSSPPAQPARTERKARRSKLKQGCYSSKESNFAN